MLSEAKHLRSEASAKRSICEAKHLRSAASAKRSICDDRVQQLITYKQFKELARELGEMEAANRQTFVRVAPPPKIERKVDLSDVMLDLLLKLVREALSVDKPQAGVGTVV